MAYLIDRDEKLTIWDRLWLPGILRGMAITARHFLTNLIHIDRRITVEYPEQKKKLPPGYRAEPRLTLRPDGSVRCTACMLCQTVCPAGCIEVEAEEVSDPAIEKRASSFVIDLSRCVFCGLCVEACPCDALRMDTGRYDRVARTKQELVLDRDALVENSLKSPGSLSKAL